MIWLKAFHIMSMVSWFAMLFYLPRLFVYHAERADNKGFIEVVRVMEYKLYKYIGVPAFWATLISGIFLIDFGGVNMFTTGGWLHAKLTIVAFLIAYFFYLGKTVKFLATNEPIKSGEFYRVLNEIPTFMMIGIVILAVVKPF